MDIGEILKYLDKKEIDYRFVSNHHCGYIFYFLDGSVYPRRYHDNRLDENVGLKPVVQSVDNLIELNINTEITKDWIHVIYGEDLNNLFTKVEKHIFNG